MFWQIIIAVVAIVIILALLLLFELLLVKNMIDLVDENGDTEIDEETRKQIILSQNLYTNNPLGIYL